MSLFRRQPPAARRFVALLIFGLFALSMGQAEDVAPPADGSEHVSASPSNAGDDGHHGDPIAPVLLGVIVIVLAARAGGHLFERWHQPAVLGELLVGVLLGNLSLLGWHQFDFLKVEYTHHRTIDVLDYQTFAGITIDHLARIGVILLLFQVGLESSIVQMRKVGGTAFLVAVIGVVVPTALGWGCGRWMLPDHPWPVHMYLGATLCATSVGITARVLQDLGQETSREAQIVLGAAVIDDVLGLIVLALAQGVILSMSAAAAGASSAFGPLEIGVILLKAVGFLAVALVLGRYISRPLFKTASFLHGKGLLIVSALTLCFLFAWAADAVGLATIVGAFAAGLVLEETQYHELVEARGEHQLENLLRPLSDLLVPIFFVEMGLHVDLRSFADVSILGLAALLTLAAILGKQACALGVRGPETDRLSIGLGMIPRGEVGLIFAAIGRGLRIGDEAVVDQSTYSALLVMVMVTTLVTPPLLKWSFDRHRNKG